MIQNIIQSIKKFMIPNIKKKKKKKRNYIIFNIQLEISRIKYLKRKK